MGITHLSINPGLSVFHNKPDPNWKIFDDDLSGLKSLQHLQLACRCLFDLAAGAFYGLDNVTVLDLSNNVDLMIEGIAQGLSRRDVLPKLTELYLSNTSTINKNPYQIKRGFLESMMRKSLKVFDISDTETAWVESTLASGYAFPHLEILNISNAGTVLASLSDIFENLTYPWITSFRHLEIIDISYPSAKMAELVFGKTHYKDIKFFIPNTVREVYAKKFFLSAVNKEYDRSNSTHVCTSKTSKSKTFQICFIGKFHNLTKLVLSENSFTYLDPNLINAFQKLKVLDVSKNELGETFTQSYARQVLDILFNLEVLDLSENIVGSFPREIFQSSRSLRILNLSRNRLKAVTFDIKDLVSLEKLDLSYNKIAFFDVYGINQLSNMLDTLGVNGTITRTEKHLILTGNPFECSCRSVESLNWLATLTDSFTCQLNSDQVLINDYSIKRAEFMCKQNTVITIYSIMAFMELVLFVGISYFIVREIRRSVLRRKKEKQIKDGIERFAAMNKNAKQPPPVFLSFCSEDEDYVMEHIFPSLDNGLKKLLNTDDRCVATGEVTLIQVFLWPMKSFAVLRQLLLLCFS